MASCPSANSENVLCCSVNYGCKRILPVERFITKNGKRRNACFDCERARDNQRLKERPYRQKAVSFLHTARKRDCYVAIDVDIDYVEKLFAEAKNCAICGLKFEGYVPTFGVGKRKKGMTIWNSISLDKINAAIGYRKDNIALLCTACNFDKGNLTPEKAQRLAYWLSDNWVEAA